MRGTKVVRTHCAVLLARLSDAVPQYLASLLHSPEKAFSSFDAVESASINYRGVPCHSNQLPGILRKGLGSARAPSLIEAVGSPCQCPSCDALRLKSGAAISAMCHIWTFAASAETLASVRIGIIGNFSLYNSGRLIYLSLGLLPTCRYRFNRMPRH